MIHVYVQGDDLSLFDLTPFINLSDRNLSVVCNAEQGSVGTSSFLIDDPDGELDDQLNGLRFVFIDEDEAPAEHQRAFVGFTASRDGDRGDYGPVGVSRQFNLQVEDINSLLSRRVMTGGDNNRPAESDVERVEWLMSTGESGHFDDTVTFIDTSGPVDMDADVNYEGQMFNSVLDDCAQQSGKNYYARWLWNDYLDDYESAVWYGPDDAASALSDLRISNVLSDVDADVGTGETYPDSSTWHASLDSKLTIDPSRLFYGVFANYDGGVTYRSLSTTRDTITSWPNIKTLTKANARSDRYLATLGVEEEVVTTSILVPPHNVNDAMAGDEIEVRFSHFPGWEDFRAVRILNRTVTFVTPEVYQIDYTLTPIDTTPPISCTTTVLGLVGHSEGDSGPGSYKPAVITPTAPDVYPSVVVGCVIAFQPGTFIGGPEALSGGSPYTMMSNTGASGGVHTNMLDAYRALSAGSPGALSMDWAGGTTAQDKSGLWVSVPTAATAPVQIGAVQGTGAIVTLPNPPTPGNLLILFRFTETSPYSSAPAGFTGLASLGFSDVWAACVQPGHDENYGIGDSSFSHWAFLSEWELT